MRVLILGKGSYIGSHIKAHLEKSGHQAYEADAENGEWKTIDYASWDAVVHVAAIVHQNAKNAGEALFERVNTELPVAVAELAKSQGVSMFVFLSTMGVYGKEKSLKKADSIIDKNTREAAVNGYGGSKLKAEKQLKTLADDRFRVAVVRPPNVYGPGCRGNYMPLFKKLALSFPVFPFAYAETRQSMLYIDNLCELIRLIVEKKADGVYLPQDDAAPSAVELVRQIRAVYGKKTYDSRFLGLFVRLFSAIPVIKKVYGGICYDDALSASFDNQYRIVGFADGLKYTYS